MIRKRRADEFCFRNVLYAGLATAYSTKCLSIKRKENNTYSDCLMPDVTPGGSSKRVVENAVQQSAVDNLAVFKTCLRVVGVTFVRCRLS